MKYSLGYANPFRYRSYYYDVETGLYYLNSRYYDPEVGRFINADALEMMMLSVVMGDVLGTNLFAYCGNNPVMNIDPTGYFYISNKQLTSVIKTLFMVCAFNPIGATFVAIGAYKLYAFIVAKAALLGAKLGSIGGPIAAVAVATLFGLVIGFSGWTIVDALLQKKGISITWKKTWWGMPYGLDIGVK